MGAYPSRLLIKAASGVLVALRGSTYGREYAFASSFAAALLATFLNSLRIVVDLSVGLCVSRVRHDEVVSQLAASRTAAMPG